jgi:hypothetical protein
VNLASTLYEDGQLRRAAYWRRQARDLCRQFDLIDQEAIMLARTADSAFTRGKKAQATRWLEEAEMALSGSEWKRAEKDVAAVRERIRAASSGE